MTNIPPAPPDSMPLLKAAARKAGLAETALGATLLWLAEQLAGEEFAKLGQGGHTHNQVPLRRVFVDLPVNSPHRSERVNFLDVFLRAGPVDLQKACSFNVAGRIVSENEDERSNAKKGIPRVDFAAVLLIGGPGQGKSTLGQLACQLQRAALLRPFRSQLAYNHRDILESFDAPVADDSSSLALAARPLLPLQVSLPELAGWLATAAPRAVSTHDTYSILEFLASLPSARKSGIAGSHLFNLAVSMPSLIVLDGFDEVGATLDRERIVTATRELLSGLAERGAEAKVIAATRPQGYGGELGRIGVSLQQCVLAPLEYSEAIGYAEKLVQAKVPGVDFQQKTLSRLREAAKEPATARLLTTPLQVTILTALVQQGRAPRERWKLFWSYFDYTYKREIERETYASRLLADHRSHIEQIHSRVALLLQVEAERDGGAAARMPRNRLEGIVDTILAEDEIEAGARRELVEDILVAAEQRLVFLVEPEPGSFGFEIRSLQEFMAAWALTSGREADVKTRLQQVVRAPMFRNVLLFIASRLFSEGSHLRDALADEICGHLDGEPTEVFGRTTKPGALLALEILEEGAVLSQPKRARALMERAVGLFSVAAGAEHLRLARVVNADTVGIVEAAILASVHENGGTRLSAAAWTCIFEGASRNEDWAKRLADELWDYLVGSNEVWQACIRARVPIGSWMAKKIELSASAFPPEEVIRAVVTAERVASCWIEWLAAVYEKIDRPRGIPSFAMRGVQLQGSIEAPASEELPAPPTAWKPWIAAAKYELSPSIDGLADTLDSIAEQLPTDRWPSLAFRSTWPLAACLYGAGSRDELSDFSARLRRGELGDSKTWHDSQATWQLDSVRPLSGLSDSALPWSLAGISKSPPFHLLSPFHFVHHNPEAIQLVESASGHLATTTNRVARRKLAEFCLSCLRSLPPKTGVAEIDILTWVNEAPEAIGHLIPRPRVVTKKLWLKVLDAVAQAGLRSRAFVGLEGALVAIVDSGGNTVATNMAIDALRMRVSRNDVAWAEVSLPRKPRVAATLRAVAARGGDRGIIAILRLLWRRAPMLVLTFGKHSWGLCKSASFQSLAALSSSQGPTLIWELEALMLETRLSWRGGLWKVAGPSWTVRLFGSAWGFLCRNPHLGRDDQWMEAFLTPRLSCRRFG